MLSQLWPKKFRRDAFRRSRRRRPAQSLQDKLHDLNFEVISGMAFAYISGIAIIAALIARLFKHGDAVFIAILAGFFFIGLWTFHRNNKRANSVVLGIRGEIKVADNLYRLERKGACVIHDIQGPDFNVDHLVIALGGIFVIETKHKTKVGHAPHQLEFDGESISYRGSPIIGDPISQVLGNVKFIERELKVVGVTAPVKPIICYPGWFIKDTRKHPRKAWVLHQDAIADWIARESPVLTDEQVHELYIKLSDRYEPELTE